MRLELRSSYHEGHCSSSMHHALFLLNSMKTGTMFCWESWIRKNTSIWKFLSSDTSTLWFPWIELVSLFPSSQPSDYNFFPLKCCDACEHSPAGTSEFRTKSLLNRKGDRGNIASSCGEILWHFPQVCSMCVVVFYEIFMSALHFSSPFPFMVGLFLLFFCNRDFIFKYEIVIMKKGSLFPELHSCIHNFFWLMWKQLPHQSFSPGPIICKHQMKPHIAMQIIVPRDLQYNHPVTRKVKRRGNYHNGPQSLHMIMLRGLDGRSHHHSKDILAFLWKCVLPGRERCCWLSLGETWSSTFFGSDGLDWIIHILSS